ncbi:MAG: hypothetical protein ING90_01735 [Rhodocyclaceae bacterium]|nr:hypothetical protein [Rhodocyclaceae bacterium]
MVEGRFGFYEHAPGTQIVDAGSRSLPPDGEVLIPHERNRRKWDAAFYALRKGDPRRGPIAKDVATQFAMGFRAALALEELRQKASPSKGGLFSRRRIEQFLTSGKTRRTIARQREFLKAADPIIRGLVAQHRAPTVELLLSKLSRSGWIDAQNDLSTATARRWLKPIRLG